METETEKILKALDDALNNNYFNLLQLTGTKDPVEGAISLLKYKRILYIESTGPGDYTQPGDYSEGAEVRAIAVRLLGTIGDERAVLPLKYACSDPGDDAGANDSRSSFYYTNRDLVKQAAKTALNQLLASLLTSYQDEIRVVHSFKEYILSPEELRRRTPKLVPALPSESDYDEDAMPTFRWSDSRDNFLCFKEDLLSNRLEGYEGSFVAYYKGILCGQSKNRDLLYQEASKLYDENNPYKVGGLAVFKVPSELPKYGAEINLVQDAIGKF